MKKLFITLAVLAAAAFSANAQFRVEAGVNLASYKFTGYTTTQTTNAKPNFRVSALYDFIDSADWAFETGLTLSGTTCYRTTASVDATMKAMNLDLPIRGAYTWRVTDNFWVTPSIGLYVGVGLSNKTEAAGITTDNLAENGDLKRFRFGTDDELLLTIAQHITIGIGYFDSLYNMCKDTDCTIKDSGVYFTVGYAF